MGPKELTNNIQNIPCLFKTFLILILKQLCNFCTAVIPPKANVNVGRITHFCRGLFKPPDFRHMFASEEPTHPLLLIHLAWSRRTSHRRCLLPTSREAPPSSLSSQTQILLVFGIPAKTIFSLIPALHSILHNTYFSKGAILLQLAVGNHILTFGAATDLVNHSITAVDASTHSFKAPGPCFVKICHMRETTSKNICQPSFHWGGSRAHTRCCHNLAGCLSGSASFRRIASEVC